MADQIAIEVGARPWEPTAESEVVETYAYYDQPILGLIRQSGHPYVFRCVDLVGDRYSVWAYVLIEDREVARLDEADDLNDALTEVTAGKPFTVALVDEAVGIFEWWFLDEELKEFPSILDSTAIRRSLVPVVTEQAHRLEDVREHVVEEMVH
jgi:hypothetical protein